jgi:hypothetical protein
LGVGDVGLILVGMGVVVSRGEEEDIDEKRHDRNII